MPQLDIYSFGPVINWLIIIIFIFYIINVVKGLGVLNKILNYRRRNRGYYVGVSTSLLINEERIFAGASCLFLLMMLVTGVLGLIVIYNFLLLKENEEFGHISEGSSENSTPVVLQGSPGVPSGGNGDDDPDNDKKKKKAKEEEERKEKEKAAKNTGVSWGWWACGALLVVVIIGGIIYYYWSEGEGTGNGGDKGNPPTPPSSPMPPSSPTPPSTNTESKNTGTFATGATRRSVEAAVKLAAGNAGGKLLTKMPTLSANSNNLTASSNNLTANSNNLTASSNNLTASSNNLTASSNNLTASSNNLTANSNNLTANSNNLTANSTSLPANSTSLPASGTNLGASSSTVSSGESATSIRAGIITTVGLDRQSSEDDDGPGEVQEVGAQEGKQTEEFFSFTKDEEEVIRNTLISVTNNYEKVSGEYNLLNEKEQESYNGVIINNRCMSLSKIKLLIELFITHLEQEKDFMSILKDYNNGCIEKDKLDNPGKAFSTDFVEDILRLIMIYLNRYSTREESKKLYPKVENFVEIGRQIVERIKKAK